MELAKLKVSKSDYEGAKEIADLFYLPYLSIGLREDGTAPL